MLDVKKTLAKILQRITPTIQTASGVTTVNLLGILVQWGSNTQAVSSSANVTWNTTFPRQFATAPAVFTQVTGTSNPKIFTVVVNNIAATGCTFIRGSSSSTSYNCTINWFAIGIAS